MTSADDSPHPIRPPAGMAEEILIAACVFLGPLALGCVDDWSAAILRACLAALLLRALRTNPGNAPLLHRTFLPAVAGLIALGILQLANPTAAGEPRYLPLGTAAPWATKKALLHLACLAALLWRGPQLFGARTGAARRFAWTVVAAGSAVALIGLLQKSAGDHWIYGMIEVRAGRVPFGPYLNHNHATTLMGMSLLTGLGLLLSRQAGFWVRLAEGESYSNFVAVQVILLGALGLLSAGIAASVSRGGYLAIALSLILVTALAGPLAVESRKRAPLRWAAAAAVLLLVTAVWLQPRWVGLIHGGLDRSASSRISLYLTGLEVVRDHPWLGVGLGAFQEVFPAYQKTEPGFLIDHIHNDWLELLIETGAAGFAVYFGGLAAFLVLIVKRWRSLPRDRLALSAGGLGASMVFIIHGILDFPHHIPANAFIFFAGLVWLDHVSALDRPPEPEPEKFLRAGPSAWAVRAAALCLGAWALRPAAAALETRRGHWGDPIPHLERACAWDPVPVRWHALAARHYLNAQQANADAPRHSRESLRISKHVLELRPLHPDTRNLHAALLSALGRSEDAGPLVTFSYK